MNGGKVFVDEDDNKKLVDFWEVRHARETDSMVIIVRDAEENCPKLSLNEREELKRKEAMRIQALRQASEKFVRREKQLD